MKLGDFTSRPEDPINPGDKAGATFSGTSRQGRGLRNDQWPRIQLQRDAGGGAGDRKSSSSRRRYGPDRRRSSHSRQRPNLRLDKPVSSPKESRMSQTSRPWRIAEMGAIIHMKTSARVLARSIRF